MGYTTENDIHIATFLPPTLDTFCPNTPILLSREYVNGNLIVSNVFIKWLDAKQVWHEENLSF